MRDHAKFEGLTMEPPSTNPDDYIRVGRLSLIVSGILLAVGVALVAWGADQNKPLSRELGSQIGVALVTTAVIDLLLLRGVESWKRSVAAPFVGLADSMLKTDAAMDKILAETETVIREVKEDSHRDQVETKLELIMNELEALRLAIDPDYRNAIEMIESKRKASTTQEAEDPPNTASAADA